MPFDINALFADPMLRVGLGLLGGSGPRMAGYGQAGQMLDQMQQQKLAQAYRDQMGKHLEAQTGLLGKQTAMEDFKLNQAAEMQKQGQKLLDQINTMYGVGGAPAGPGAQPLPQGSPLPQQPPLQSPYQQPTPVPSVGKYGTPTNILDNLEHVESSGNPLAIGPDIGGGVKALGAFQFLPSTIKQLKDQGITFDPFNKQQSRDAADYYLQSLAKKNGGDMSKALADYGGFKTKDSTSYVNRVLQGSPEKQAMQHVQMQNAAQAQQTSGANFPAGLQPSGAQTQPVPNAAPQGQLDPYHAMLLRSVAMEMAGGDPKAYGKLADVLKPEFRKPGDVKIGPDGTLTSIADPLGERKTAAEEARAAADLARAGFAGNKDLREQALQPGAMAQQAATTQHTQATTQQAQVATAEGQQKLGKEKAQVVQTIQANDENMQRMSDLADKLLKHPGLNAITGAVGGRVDPSLLGTKAMDAASLLDQLRSKMFVQGTLAIRQASPTGAGVGNQSDWEGKRLESAMGNLGRVQSYDQLKTALEQVKEIAGSSTKRIREAYKIGYGEEAPFMPAKKQLEAPAGAKQFGTSGGKPVYQLPDGSLVISK